MCNRYVYKMTRAELRAHFGVEVPEQVSLPIRYNLAPTQEIPAIVKGRNGPEFAMLRWGFPAQFGMGHHTNAKSETAHDSRTFQGGARCILPASGFYEWQHTGQKPQPWYFEAVSGVPLAFAGLMLDGGAAILTQAANADVSPLHDRMPVLLSRDQFRLWFSPRSFSLEDRLAVFVPTPKGFLMRRPVSLEVNSTRNEGPELLKPPATQQGELF